MAREVFISHARKDGEIAGAVCRKLESTGVKCWMAPRDIAAGEDWTKAIRNAIEASRAMVLLFSDNANAAPHVEREIANAFYTKRTIVPFRMTKALPRRELLFYLGDAQWFDAHDPPEEQDLEALTRRIKELLAAMQSPANNLALQKPLNKRAMLDLANSSEARPGTPRRQVSRVLKHAAVAASIAGAAWLLWFASQQTKQDPLVERSNAQSTSSVPRTSSARAEGDASESAPHYSFSRLGLWVPVNASSTPAAQPEPQNTSDPAVQASPGPAVQPLIPKSSLPPSVEQNGGGEKEEVAVHNSAGSMPYKTARSANPRDRHRKRSRSKPRSVDSWLAGLLHTSVARVKEVWNH
jgi:TIR domain